MFSSIRNKKMSRVIEIEKTHVICLKSIFCNKCFEFDKLFNHSFLINSTIFALPF